MNHRIAQLAEVQFKLWNARAVRVVARQPRVLIVDADPGSRAQHAEVVRDQGCEVEMVNDGEAAIMKLAFQHFDLVMTDWHMPRLDGASLVVWLRAMGNSVPVILIAPGPLADLPASVGKELAAIFAKPVAHGRLIHAVQKLLHVTNVTTADGEAEQNVQTKTDAPLESLRPFRI